LQQDVRCTQQNKSLFLAGIILSRTICCTGSLCSTKWYWWHKGERWECVAEDRDRVGLQRPGFGHAAAVGALCSSGFFIAPSKD